jgi:L-lactate dehydrogenase (cytochrome)
LRAFNIADLRTRARARLPRMVFDYMDGGADDECTLRANAQRFRDYELTWDALRDIAALSTATTVLGCATQLPLVICPTATSRLFDPRGGERAVARAAHTAGIIYSCSALATTCARCSPAPKRRVSPRPSSRSMCRWRAIVNAISTMTSPCRRA